MKNQGAFKTVEDLSVFMEKHDLSAEVVAKELLISNMTIRRILRQKPELLLSQKQVYMLSPLWTKRNTESTIPSLSLDTLGSPKVLEEALAKHKAQAEKISDPEKIKQELTVRLKAAHLTKEFSSTVKNVSKHAFQTKNRKVQLLAMAGLLYFLNPMDLIPDSIPYFGLMDDFLVLSLVMTLITRELQKQSKNPNPLK